MVALLEQLCFLLQTGHRKSGLMTEVPKNCLEKLWALFMLGDMSAGVFIVMQIMPESEVWIVND